MPILNYTTSIDAETSVAKIQKMLAMAGASEVMQQYDGNSVLIGLAFRMRTAQGVISFRLPANIEGVHAVLLRDKRVKEKKHKTREHAARVAWRILKDWIEAQIAIIESEMATAAQVFLPYATTDNGQTVYERFEGGNMKMIGNK